MAYSLSPSHLSFLLLLIFSRYPICWKMVASTRPLPDPPISNPIYCTIDPSTGICVYPKPVPNCPLIERIRGHCFPLQPPISMGQPPQAFVLPPSEVMAPVQSPNLPEIPDELPLPPQLPLPTLPIEPPVTRSPQQPFVLPPSELVAPLQSPNPPEIPDELPLPPQLPLPTFPTEPPGTNSPPAPFLLAPSGFVAPLKGPNPPEIPVELLLPPQLSSPTFPTEPPQIESPPPSLVATPSPDFVGLPVDLPMPDQPPFPMASAPESGVPALSPALFYFPPNWSPTSTDSILPNPPPLGDLPPPVEAPPPLLFGAPMLVSEPLLISPSVFPVDAPMPLVEQLLTG